MKHNFFVHVIIGAILILIFIRLFTVILRHKDDPTISLGIKFNPLKENEIFQYDSETEGSHIILYSDENELRGESLLSIIYKLPPIIFFIILIVFVLFYKIKGAIM